VPSFSGDWRLLEGHQDPRKRRRNWGGMAPLRTA
jgi:hypothetical protein